MWRSFPLLTRLLCAALALAAAGASPACARSRIKDVVAFEGVRENKLVGYGLVVGLNGTGDTLRNAPFTQQSLQSMLERLGVNTRNSTNIDTKDVAAVMVTASLPAFAASGSEMDVSVSAMGDAKSLLGGTLVVTPLLGADGRSMRWPRARCRPARSPRPELRAPPSPAACPPPGASPTGRRWKRSWASTSPAWRPCA